MQHCQHIWHSHWPWHHSILAVQTQWLCQYGMWLHDTNHSTRCSCRLKCKLKRLLVVRALADRCITHAWEGEDSYSPAQSNPRATAHPFPRRKYWSAVDNQLHEGKAVPETQSSTSQAASAEAIPTSSESTPLKQVFAVWERPTSSTPVPSKRCSLLQLQEERTLQRAASEQELERSHKGIWNQHNWRSISGLSPHHWHQREDILASNFCS